MKALIIGNTGYVGPGVVAKLRNTCPNAELAGYDIGNFASRLTNVNIPPEVKLSFQIICDIRNSDNQLLEDADAVVYLAAMSNDPMRARFEDMTYEVKFRSAIQIAKMAKQKGIKNFIFTSICSIYGAGDDNVKTESDTLNPLTAYAKSKVMAENDLEPLANSNFIVPAFRFATPRGYSNRLRLDLVLNDFVAGVAISKEITFLSDNTPWRPLIKVLDMARAIECGITRPRDKGGVFLVVKTGINAWNYQVIELAHALADIIPDVDVSINKDVPVNKRSCKVNYEFYSSLVPDHQPVYDLKTSIKDLHNNFL